MAFPPKLWFLILSMTFLHHNDPIVPNLPYQNERFMLWYELISVMSDKYQKTISNTDFWWICGSGKCHDLHTVQLRKRRHNCDGRSCGTVLFIPWFQDQWCTVSFQIHSNTSIWESAQTCMTIPALGSFGTFCGAVWSHYSTNFWGRYDSPKSHRSV